MLTAFRPKYMLCLGLAKEDSMPKPTATSSLLAAGAIFALMETGAHAVEVKVSGTDTHVIVSNESQPLNDGRTLLTIHDKGVIETSDPQSPFHLAKEDCFYSVILDAKGGIADGGGYCIVFDEDFDGYWLSWNFTPNGSAWTIYHGTGKFEGMTGGGTSKPLVNFADRYTLAYEATLTMK